MKYWVIINGQQQGPVEESQLPSMGVTRDTMVWREGMPQWQTAGALPELSYLFNGGYASNTNADSTVSDNVNYGNDGGFQPVMPKTWLTEAILCTIFCCVPFGIVGIVFASQVGSAWSQGNYELAEAKSQVAKKWVTISFILGIVGGVIGFFVGLFGEL